MLLLLVFSGYGQESQRLLPDLNRHKDFLLDPWQSHKPVLIAFKDPRCPYCVKALRNRHHLKNYNVFLFWAPILGENSRLDVEAFFHCKSPSDPALLQGVIQGERARCTGQYKAQLASLNAEMVASYQPSYVPQYWFGGRSVSFETLLLASSRSDEIKTIAAESLLKIPWRRYDDFLFNKGEKGAINLAVVLPDTLISDQRFKALVARHPEFNWYLFNGQNRPAKDSEFRLLNDLQRSDKPAFILEGQLMTKAQIQRLIEPGADRIFDSKLSHQLK